MIPFYSQLSDEDKLKFMLLESSLKQMPNEIEVKGFHSKLSTKEILINMINERFE